MFNYFVQQPATHHYQCYVIFSGSTIKYVWYRINETYATYKKKMLRLNGYESDDQMQDQPDSQLVQELEQAQDHESDLEQEMERAQELESDTVRLTNTLGKLFNIMNTNISGG